MTAPNENAICAWCGAAINPRDPWTQRPPRCADCARSIELKRVRMQNARARRMGLPATLSIESWLLTLAHFSWCCATCGGPFEVVDHLVPIGDGGSSSAVNMVPSCKVCNCVASHESPERIILGQILVRLHRDTEGIVPNQTSVQALQLQWVLLYTRTVRLGLGISQSKVAAHLQVSQRSLFRYESKPPDGVPSAVALIRLMTLLPIQPDHLARLLEADADESLALDLAEQAIHAAPVRVPSDPTQAHAAQISADLIKLTAALRSNDALRQAVDALVRGWPPDAPL